MEPPRQIWARLRSLFRRDALERGLDEEIRFHLEQQTRKNERRGMDPDAARRAALLRFGGVERVKEEVRDEVRPARLEDLARDLRHAVRGLARSPGFTLVAVGTLALGIGSNTAIFSLVDGILLRPLPLPEPDRILAVGESAPDGPPTELGSTSPAGFLDWRRGTTRLRLAAYSGTEAIVTGRGEPERLLGATTAGGLFQVLGSRPLLGRVLLPADEDPEAERVVVLSQGAWRRWLGGDRGALGRTLTLNGTPHTVVGVMPEGFRFPDGDAEFWIPARWSPEARANRDQFFLRVVGRLVPGATAAQARSELDAVAERLRRDWPAFNGELRIRALPLQETMVAGVRTRLLVLMGAVAFVLLITCANLGNLLLARAAARRREIAVRRALGAERGRIVQQLLVESLVLALAGAAAGLAVGRALLALLLSADAVLELPRVEEIGLDPRVLGFTLAVALAAGVLFGTLPAWHLARGGPGEALREGARGSAATSRARAALVVSEVALAMVLLVGAGLLLRSFALLQRVDPGFPTERLLTFDVSLARSDPELFRAALEEIRAIPGVRSASTVSHLPVTGPGISAWFNRIDRPTPPDGTPPTWPYRVVSPEYFATLDLPLRRGRPLTAADRAESPGVVINEALARRHYPGEDPIGREIYLGAPDNRLFERARIVGVVGDTRDGGLASDPLPTVYVPHAVMPYWRWFSFVMRTSGPPAAVAAEARAAVRRLEPGVPVGAARTLEEVMAESVAPARWSTVLLGLFAAVALATAALGVFGVLSFLVAQRTRELGIRMALGAAPGAVRGMVFGQGVRLVALGLVIGLGGALALTRWMEGLLYAVTPTDPLTYGAVAALLAAIAALASWLPARRATRVDPVLALRRE